MTDIERLIELVDKAKEEYANDITDHTETDYIVECLLNNDVIVPPCKVGDTVYMITPNGNIRNLTILNIDIKIEKKEVEMTCFAVYEFENKPCYLQIPSFKFGKTVFLTKEEAEEKLKEREG